MILRPYQQACHDAVWRTWGEIGPDLRVMYGKLIDEIGHDPFGPEVYSDRLCVELPTSAGKTILSAQIIQTARTRGLRSLFVGDTDELIDQPVDKFRKAAGIIAAVEKAERRASLEADVVVGSMQSLGRKRLARYPRDHFDVILVDEIHRSTDRKASVWEYFEKAKVAGLTGTAFRQNTEDLSDWLPITPFRLSVFDMRAQGYVPRLRVLRLPIEVDASQLVLGASPDGRDVTAQSADRTIRPYFHEIARILRDHPRLKDRTVLVFLPLIESSKLFVEVCRQEGLTAQHCDGSTPDRSGILHAFEEGRFRILANPQTFSTGVDFIRCDCVLNLRVTRSVGLYRQIIGRGLRIPPGVIDGLETPEGRRKAIEGSAKPDCLILDILWQADMLTCGADCLADELDDPKVREAIESGEPVDLEDIRAKVLKAKETELERAIEERAKRKASLMDPEEAFRALRRPELVAYFPDSATAAKPPTDTQLKALATRGVYGEEIKTRGQAEALLAIMADRTKRGLTPLYTFAALRQEGYDAPEVITLDMAIRILGAQKFPMGFGVHAGKPFAKVPKGVWVWVHRNRYLPWLRDFPSEVRYAAKVVQNLGRRKSLAS